jgi:hypothetical protein
MRGRNDESSIGHGENRIGRSGLDADAFAGLQRLGDVGFEVALGFIHSEASHT